MSLENHDKLATLIQRDREVLLGRWREQVSQLASAKHLDIPTLNDHVPNLLDELSTALHACNDLTIPQALRDGSSPAHGLQRVQDRYDIEEVVAEYNILRDCIHDLADSNGLSLQGKPFHILNRVLDGAIGLAVQTFATRQALEVQHRREEYLAFVAHDLRTPLNAISLSARVLQMTLSDQSGSSEVPRMLKALHRNVQQLEGLVRKIMDENANLQTELGVKLQRRAFDLWPLVESLIHDLHPVAGTASTRLINEVPDDLVVYADASLLTRVFQNLIANAIRYTPHGKIVIGAHELGANGAVECWVSDNGSGIPLELLDKLFDKGETDPQNEAGLGLGLAIVKTFTEAHGGKVVVESKEHVGSTFRFSLPGRSEGSI
jgi:two-component system, OmpR family, phosphate regulon sensor histidine kinase PhoR